MTIQPGRRGDGRCRSPGAIDHRWRPSQARVRGRPLIVVFDLPYAAFFAGGNLLDIGNGARDDFIQPMAATSDGRHKRNTHSQNKSGEYPVQRTLVQ